MANLTTTQYATIVGSAAPATFDTLLTVAQSELDLRTWYYYTDASALTLPDAVSDALLKFLAFGVQYLNDNGGMDGLTEGDANSVSLGKFSYTKDASQSGSQSTAVFSHIADMQLPLLISYADTYRGEDE